MVQLTDDEIAIIQSRLEYDIRQIEELIDKPAEGLSTNLLHIAEDAIEDRQDILDKLELFKTQQ